MGLIDVSIKNQFRVEAVEEVHKMYPDLKMPGSFEEALISLETGKAEEAKMFLLFYTIYSEKCEEYAALEKANGKNMGDISEEIDDSMFDTKDFLKQKFNDWMKDL